MGLLNRRFKTVWFLLLLWMAAAGGKAIAADLYLKAVNNTAAQAASSLVQWAKQSGLTEREKKIALWDIENDDEDVFIARLEAKILKTGVFKLYTRSETADFKKILNEHNRQIKYQDSYDSPVMLKGMIAPQRVLVGRLTDVQAGDADTALTFCAKMLDLETGEVVWADILSVEEAASLTGLSWAWRIAFVLIFAALLVVLVFMLNQQTINKIHVWFIFAAVWSVAFWYLIGRFL